jgi:hypothetical protein
MLDYARITTEAKKIDNFDKFYDEFYSDNFFSTKKEEIKSEMNLFSTIPYNDYLQHLFDKKVVTTNVLNYLKEFGQNIENFINTKPNALLFDSFVLGKYYSVNNLNYCENDKIAIKLYLKYVQGFGTFFYDHYQDTQAEGCNFWQGLWCGLKGLAISIYDQIGKLYKLIKGEVKFEVKDTLLGGLITPFTIAIGSTVGYIIAGAYLAYATYLYVKKCCAPKRDNCEVPNGNIVRIVDCNTFDITLVGKGDYFLTNWHNDNTIPANAVTTIPNLRLKVPNFSLNSIIRADVYCNDDRTNNQLLNYFGNVFFKNYSNSVPPTLQWAVNPKTGSVNQKIEFDVIVGTRDQFVATWSAGSGATITQNGNSYQAFITFPFSGWKTVTVTLTNTCTGETTSISHTIIIN